MAVNRQQCASRRPRATCGFASPAQGEEDSSLDLTRRFITRPTSTFVFRVESGTLSNVGVFVGDYLLVDRSRKPRANDIVVAVVDGCFTQALWRCQHGRVQLSTASPGIPPVLRADDIEIWGVVTSVHRDLLPPAV